MTEDRSSDSLINLDELRQAFQDALSNFSIEDVLKDVEPPPGLSIFGLNSAEPPNAVPPEPPDLDLASMVQHPCVVLILGHRGGGKTALACRLQELKKDIAAPYGVGLPPNDLPPIFVPPAMLVQQGQGVEQQAAQSPGPAAYSPASCEA